MEPYLIIKDNNVKHYFNLQDNTIATAIPSKDLQTTS